MVCDSLSTAPVSCDFSPLINGPLPSNLVPFFSFFLFEKRFNQQYSKEYKAKEVSEGEESKDFWNVLGGKANFLSLSEGLYCTILRISFSQIVRAS